MFKDDREKDRQRVLDYDGLSDDLSDDELQ